MKTVVLIDDSGSTGGAQNLVRLLSWRLNKIPEYQAVVVTTETALKTSGGWSITINCTDWCMEGFKNAEKLREKCDKMYLLSQISFFKPFANLYVDWEHHLWNMREKAKQYYDAVITLSPFQDKLWSAAGWKTICAPWMNASLSRPCLDKIVICAAHWNKNKDKDEILQKAAELRNLFDPEKPDIESHSLDDYPATPDEMFKPGTVYFHSSKTDVNPMTIHEAAIRGAIVVVDEFPGLRSLLSPTCGEPIFTIGEFTTQVINNYYDLDKFEALLKGRPTISPMNPNYNFTAEEVLSELVAVMNSYAPKFSDIGYKCTKITGGNKK